MTSAESLIVAIKRGDGAKVAELLDTSWTLAAKVDGMCGLCHAAANGCESAVDVFLKRGATSNHSCGHGTTPLMLAAHGGHSGATAALLDNGAMIDGADNDRSTALWLACDGNRSDVVSLLLQRGACVDASGRFGMTPFMVACSQRDCKCLRLVLEHSSKVDVDRRRDDGWSALHVACAAGNAEAVELLLTELRMDVNSKSTADGRTPLHIASSQCCVGVIRQLLARGADCSSVATDGTTPLHECCGASASSLAAATLLLDNERVKVDALRSDGITPLHLAACKCNPDTVSELVRRGANVNRAALNGVTPLFLACMFGIEETAAALLRAAANPNLCNEGGFTPLMGACRQGKVKLANMLISAGANVKHRAANCESAYSLALLSNSATELSVLLAVRGAERRAVPIRPAGTKDGIVLSGWAMKLGKIKQQFKKRWVELTSAALYYYKSDTSRKQKGEIPLGTVVKVQTWEKGRLQSGVDVNIGVSLDQIFCIETAVPQRNWLFIPCSGSRLAWIGKIKETRKAAPCLRSGFVFHADGRFGIVAHHTNPDIREEDE